MIHPCYFTVTCADLGIWLEIFRELQAIENGETDPVIGPNSLDKERCLLNDDPKWLDTTYVLANYKTEPCKKPPRLCRQGYACPQFHNNKDKRRSPKKYKYRYVILLVFLYSSGKSIYIPSTTMY